MELAEYVSLTRIRRYFPGTSAVKVRHEISIYFSNGPVLI